MPPDYVMTYLPAELIGIVMAAAAIIWGAVAVRKAWTDLVAPLIHRVRETAKRIEQVAEDWSGRPGRPGVPPQPGVMERLATYDDRLAGMTEAMQRYDARHDEHSEAIADIRHQVQPNHGTSAHDKLSEQIKELKALVADAMAEIGMVRRDMTEALRHNHPEYRPPLTRNFEDRFDD